MTSIGKADLVSAIAIEGDISLTMAKLALDAVLSSIGKALKDGKRIELREFGAFSTKHRAARMGRNPRTGEDIAIAASTTVKFKPSSALGR